MNKKLCSRKVFITFIIIFLTVIQGSYIMFPIPEIWPFSPYPMYSKYTEETKTGGLKIFGVSNSGEEIPLDIAEVFQPFNRNRLKSGISRMIRRKESIAEKERKMIQFFGYLLDLYSYNKKLKRHNYPELTGLRLYVLSWDWTNGVFPDIKPEKKLIFNYQ